ncbi:hypothetical protein [Nitrosomonas sp. Nm33]|uniref:hypothetical protein n=1 Tax=Nitrosomonas sp. Nm33 TaxID=133724 RepID=UPI00115F959F|nr:hypothetical protein [Nitrosomonas sp. Nm33]
MEKRCRKDVPTQREAAPEENLHLVDSPDLRTVKIDVMSPIQPVCCIDGSILPKWQFYRDELNRWPVRHEDRMY